MKVPSFSAKFAAGSWYTVVWMSLGAAPPYSLGAFQKVAVSFSKFSAITSHFSFESAPTIFGEFGPTPTGFMPNEIKPSGPGSFPPARVEPPRYMSSKRYIQE